MTHKDQAWRFGYKPVPHLDDVRLLHVEDATHHYPRHVHEEFCIAMIHRGSETHICRDERHVAFPGDLLCVNPEDAHESISAGVEYKSIHIKPALFGSMLFTQSIVSDPGLFQRFVELYSLLESDVPSVEKEFELADAVGCLLRRHNSPIEPSESSSVQRVRDFLRSNYAINTSLSDLASIANVSPFHLVRIFNDQIGVPPHEFQTQVRITNAQRLLRDGHSISDAAVETGFFDQSHFSRNFKRITGLTPGKYLAHSNIVQDN